MVIVDSLDERLLDCAFCGKKFFDTPESALFGWDDTTPIYACVPCETAQQSVQPTGGRRRNFWTSDYAPCRLTLAVSLTCHEKISPSKFKP